MKRKKEIERKKLKERRKERKKLKERRKERKKLKRSTLFLGNDIIRFALEKERVDVVCASGSVFSQGYRGPNKQNGCVCVCVRV